MFIKLTDLNTEEEFIVNMNCVKSIFPRGRNQEYSLLVFEDNELSVCVMEKISLIMSKMQCGFISTIKKSIR